MAKTKAVPFVFYYVVSVEFSYVHTARNWTFMVEHSSYIWCGVMKQNRGIIPEVTIASDS